MIDLHIHTKHSDGTDSVKDILNNANKLRLKTISITDHDSCAAYEEMNFIDISQLYDENIIKDSETFSSYDIFKRTITILA